MLDFGRNLCSDACFSTEREWLVTNGIGGYASGTVAGVLTRRYHGLLVAALQAPLGRTLLLTKLDETATYDGAHYPLFANRGESLEVEPEGFYTNEARDMVCIRFTSENVSYHYRVAQNLLFEVNVMDELSAIWILDLEEDYGFKKEMRYRKGKSVAR